MRPRCRAMPALSESMLARAKVRHRPVRAQEYHTFGGRGWRSSDARAMVAGELGCETRRDHFSKQIKHIRHADAHATNAGPAAVLRGVRGDAARSTFAAAKEVHRFRGSGPVLRVRERAAGQLCRRPDPHAERIRDVQRQPPRTAFPSAEPWGRPRQGGDGRSATEAQRGERRSTASGSGRHARRFDAAGCRRLFASSAPCRAGAPRPVFAGAWPRLARAHRPSGAPSSATCECAPAAPCLWGNRRQS